MFIQAAYNLNLSSAARLVSFPQPAGQTICVSFFYYIFGNSIGKCFSSIHKTKLIPKFHGFPMMHNMTYLYRLAEVYCKALW